jgi:hypothetical protein
VIGVLVFIVFRSMLEMLNIGNLSDVLPKIVQANVKKILKKRKFGVKFRVAILTEFRPERARGDSNGS